MCNSYIIVEISRNCCVNDPVFFRPGWICNMATGQLFSKTTQALFYNYKQLPIQRMLDFDFLCGMFILFLFLFNFVEEEIKFWIMVLIHLFALHRERNTISCWNHHSWCWGISKIVLRPGRNCHPSTFHVCILGTYSHTHIHYWN